MTCQQLFMLITYNLSAKIDWKVMECVFVIYIKIQNRFLFIVTLFIMFTLRYLKIVF